MKILINAHEILFDIKFNSLISLTNAPKSRVSMIYL